MCLVAVHYPGINSINIQVEIVAKNIIYIGFTIRKQQVILLCIIISRKISFCKLIPIQNIICSKQISYCLILI